MLRRNQSDGRDLSDQIRTGPFSYTAGAGCEVITEAVHCLLLGVRPDSGPDRHAVADMLV